MTRGRFGAPLAALSCVILVGCDASEPAPGPTNFAEYVVMVVADAQEAGASDQQLAVLQQAVDAGEISFEDASAANEATIECLLDAGFTATSQVFEAAPGFKVPGYTAGRSSGMTVEQGEAILSECENRESFFVNMLYQTQPTADEAKWANFERVKPQFIECLEGAGLAVPADATNDELVDLALDLAFDESSPNPVNCLHEMGINSI